MTTRHPSQCHMCEHFRSPLDTDLNENTCDAFPDQIPDAIWWNQRDHRQPFPGDHGIRWESWEGHEFPEYAMEAILQQDDTK